MTEGISLKQRAPRIEPKPLPPRQEQAAVGKAFGDEPTTWRDMRIAFPTDHQGVAVYYYDSAADSTEIGLMPQIALYTQGAAEFSAVKQGGGVNQRQHKAKRSRELPVRSGNGAIGGSLCQL